MPKSRAQLAKRLSTCPKGSNSKEPVTAFQCMYCRVVFYEPKNLVYHKRSEHPAQHAADSERREKDLKEGLAFKLIETDSDSDGNVDSANEETGSAKRSPSVNLTSEKSEKQLINYDTATVAQASLGKKLVRNRRPKYVRSKNGRLCKPSEDSNYSFSSRTQANSKFPVAATRSQNGQEREPEMPVLSPAVPHVEF